jgi:uncharacterized delta-60 repeat protein
MKKFYLLYFFFTSLLYGYGQQSGGLYTNFAARGWDTLEFATQGYYGYQYEAAQQVLRQADGKYVILIVVAQQCSVLARYNSDGTLDNSFGSNGYSVPINLYEASKAALQVINSDNKIVVVGAAGSEPDRDFGVTRFNSDGTVDKTFGTNGRVTTDFFGGEDRASSIAIQSSDNKIVVAGLVQNGAADFGVARYNTDGSLDISGFSGGKVSVSFSSDVDYANAIAIQTDGKIVLGGTDNYDFALVRLNYNGSIDESFGNSGLVRTDIARDWDRITALAVQSDGKIVAAGDAWTASHAWDVALARYNNDGSLDITSFGTNGKMSMDISGWHDQTNALIIQPDGKFVVCGMFDHTGTGYDFSMIRFTDAGGLDASFGSNGIVSLNFGGDEVANALVMGEGGFVTVGASGNVYVILRFDSNGALVPFGSVEKVSGFYNPGLNSINYGLGLQNIDGEDKITVAGVAYTTNRMGDFAVGRYNADGTLNNSFGTNAKVVTYIQGPSTGKSIAIQADNKVLVAGTSIAWEEGDASFTLIRYTTTGLLDPIFGYGGIIYFKLRDNDLANAMAIQPDGKILIAGQAGTYSITSDYYKLIAYDFGIARLKPDGTLDSAFGINGFVVTDFSGFDDVINAIAIQKDGKIVVAGTTTSSTGYSDFALARYTTKGVLDNTFGNHGKVITDINGYDDVANAIVIQSNGRIIVAGTASNTAGYSDIALIAYTANGVLDNTFGNKGKVVTDIYGYNDFANAISLQADGKIIVSGATETTTSGVAGIQKDLAIVRYSANGSFDASFGVSGKLTTDLGYAETIYSSMWKNDKLYVAGSAEASAGFAVPSSLALTAVYNTNASTPPLAIVSINRTSVTEGDTALLTVSLNKSISSPIIVNYITVDGTAQSKGKFLDYKALKGTVTIAAGQTTSVIMIPTYNDNKNGEKYFTVNLSLNKQMQFLATIGSGTGTVTIQDAVIPTYRRVTNQEVTIGLSAKVFPNPATHYFTLRLESSNTDPISIRVIDVSGKLLEATTTTSNHEDWRFGNAYAPGVYYAQVQQGNEKVSIKVIKLAD